jgi:hypothetical protein
MSRIAWFIALNVAFSLAVVTVGLSGSMHGVHAIYLILLFALCTSCIVDIRQWNDSYALLALFSAVYFEFYGVLDLETLFGAYPSPLTHSNGPVLSETELVILVGGALAQLGYRLLSRSARTSKPAVQYDWTESALLWVGLSLFVVCTGLKWIAHVELFVTNDAATEAQELARVGNAGMFAITLGDTMQPLSMLLIFYALCRYRRALLFPIAIAVILVQAVYGFVIDVKGEVMIGGIMMVLTKTLIDGRLPKIWLLSLTVSIVLLFPALQANRVVRGQNDVNHAQAARSIVQTFKDAYAARLTVTTGEDRTQTFFERSSAKGSVEMIVRGTGPGTSVAYQHGYTLSPILAAFIPKIIWPSKPNVEAGRILNRQFHVSEDPDTYISPSHLGELYWNFGWVGVVVGMLAIGSLLGFIGARCDLSESVTVTRTLMLAVTARLLILGFESSISNQYVMWARVVLAVGVLHLLFMRPIADPEPARTALNREPSRRVSRPFSNVMT